MVTSTGCGSCCSSTIEISSPILGECKGLQKRAAAAFEVFGDWPPLNRLAIAELGDPFREGCGEAPLLEGDTPLEGREGD